MAPLRISAAVLATAGFYLLLEAGNLLLALRPRRREAWRSFIMRGWGRSLCALLGVAIDRRGIPPREPFLLVANHLSYLDILLLGGVAGGVFVAKAEIRSWPAVGRLCRAAGVIFVDRESRRDVVRVGRLIEETLGRGRGVILFPEGTTSSGGDLLPFRPPLLEVAARGSHPVHHAVVSYRTPSSAPPAARAVCWVGGEPLLSHVRRLATLPSISATLSFGEQPIQDGDRKRLAERLREAMAERFVPSV